MRLRSKRTYNERLHCETPSNKFVFAYKILYNEDIFFDVMSLVPKTQIRIAMTICRGLKTTIDDILFGPFKKVWIDVFEFMCVQGLENIVLKFRND